jgi:hypothetical protein
MEIINSSTVKQATSKTENANYVIEYTLSNNDLLRVMVAIYDLEKDDSGNDVYIGNVSFENGIMNSSLPINSNATDMITDFEVILSKIIALESEEE